MTAPLETLYPNGQALASSNYITVAGELIPWDGSVSVSVTTTGTAIEDGVDSAKRASVVQSTSDATKFGLVALNPDGSNISGGGGGGGAVTIADGADVTQGAKADSAYSGSGSASVVSILKGLYTRLGSVVIAAGSAIIGKVGIDQTTPGTTNGVVVNSSALPTGAATESTLSTLNGKVTACNTGAVTVSAALPAGTNSIGQVTANAGTNLNTSALALDTSVIALKPPLTAKALQITSSGDTILLSSGTHKIHRIKMSNSHATTALTAGIKIPSQNSGAAFDLSYLPAAGGLGIWTFPGGYLQTTSEALSINLSTTGQVETTVYYE